MFRIRSANTPREQRPRLQQAGLLAALLCALSVLCIPSLCAPADSLEYEVKAAMLYNFTRFVEWPATTWKDGRSPLILGVLGSDPFGRLLEDSMRDKTYSGRPIVLRRFHTLTELETCHVLFVAKSEKKHLKDILRLAQASSVLTVSEIDDFIQSGGTIGFVLIEDRIRFEINTTSALRSSLTISSKLLRLAHSGERHGGSD